jgi:HAD superfamily hydrolase (TIGR01450 family)
MWSRLRACTAFVRDMDGTIYVDDRLLPGARELIALLDARGHRYVFVTNNSSRRAEAYHERLARLGIDVAPGRVLTSGDATIDHLLRATPHRSCYLVGTPALEDEFRAAGLVLDDRDPDCVVVAYDTTLTFGKLEVACRHLFAGKPYYATHPDRTCITERGLIPDIAAIIAACEAVTRRTPHILGKPQPEMIAAALRRLDATAGETAIVGDQLDTDMAMGLDGGLCPVLVMTGETTPERLAAWPIHRRPALIARGADEILERLA